MLVDRSGSDKKLLEPREVSEILHVSISTLSQWRCMRRGPSYVKVGGQVRYREKAVYDWLDSRDVRVPLQDPSRPYPEPAVDSSSSRGRSSKSRGSRQSPPWLGGNITTSMSAEERQRILDQRAAEKAKWRLSGDGTRYIRKSDPKGD